MLLSVYVMFVCRLLFLLLVQRYVSNAASFVLCVFRRVKDHHILLHDSPLLKKTCVRQVVLDEWFPLKSAAAPWRMHVTT